MSTDEERTSPAAGNESGRSERFERRPNHPRFGTESKTEVVSGSAHRFDPETAHTSVGDPECLRRIPEVCFLCEAQELAETAAQWASEQTEVDNDGR